MCGQAAGTRAAECINVRARRHLWAAACPLRDTSRSLVPVGHAAAAVAASRPLIHAAAAAEAASATEATAEAATGSGSSEAAARAPEAAAAAAAEAAAAAALAALATLALPSLGFFPVLLLMPPVIPLVLVPVLPVVPAARPTAAAPGIVGLLVPVLAPLPAGIPVPVVLQLTNDAIHLFVHLLDDRVIHEMRLEHGQGVLHGLPRPAEPQARAVPVQGRVHEVAAVPHGLDGGSLLAQGPVKLLGVDYEGLLDELDLRLGLLQGLGAVAEDPDRSHRVLRARAIVVEDAHADAVLLLHRLDDLAVFADDAPDVAVRYLDLYGVLVARALDSAPLLLERPQALVALVLELLDLPLVLHVHLQEVPRQPDALGLA
mmetsp:Transcript_70120/g.189533  ORF Transcript_70120/g.189533 Transcript_70120/m.189533 type:complete len:374 (-) Transcript_70120:651-1772(-)